MKNKKNCIYNKVIKQHDNSVVSNLPALSAIHHVAKVPQILFTLRGALDVGTNNELHL